MILILGGTTEGKKLINSFVQMEWAFHYSTKSLVDQPSCPLGVYRYGALDFQGFCQYIKEHAIKLIINVAHPFASELHATVARVSAKFDIPVWRLNRVFPKREEHPLVHYVETYKEVLDLMHSSYAGSCLLALTGVQSISHLASYWQAYPSYFRILNRPSSIAMAKANQYPLGQLILAYPSQSIEAEQRIYQAHDAEVILTKESGSSGFLQTKILAALGLGLPIIVIKRPVLPACFHLFDNLASLEQSLEQKINRKWA